MSEPHTPKTIRQGAIYWLQTDESTVAHPHVVVQPDVFNLSRLDTVIVCALTTNMNKVSLPGNVLLDADEGNLTKPSVVEVAKISSVKKTQLGTYVGTLSESRIKQILAGLQFLHNMGH